MTPYDIIRMFPKIINQTAAANVKKTVQYKTTTPIHFVIENGQCTVNDGYAAKYDVGITISDDNLLALFKGELSGMAAFTSGKLKLDGDLMFAQRIPTIFDVSKVLSEMT